MKKLFVRVDTNDADYEEHTVEISDEALELIKPLIEAIKKFEPYEKPYPWSSDHFQTFKHNFPYGECLREDMGELSPYDYYSNQFEIDPHVIEVFTEYLPYCEYGFHSIVYIRVINDEEILFP